MCAIMIGCIRKRRDGRADLRQPAAQVGCRVRGFDLRPRRSRVWPRQGSRGRVPPRTRRGTPTWRSCRCQADPELAEIGERLLNVMQPGAVLVDLSTAPVDLTRELGARFAARAIAYADAPVARTRLAAERGELSVMVGADAPTFARIEPYLRCFASDVLHCGPVGTGQVVKLMNNMVLFETGVAIAEALAIGRRSGVALSAAGCAQPRLGRQLRCATTARTRCCRAYPERAFSTLYAQRTWTTPLLSPHRRALPRRAPASRANTWSTRSKPATAIAAGP